MKRFRLRPCCVADDCPRQCNCARHRAHGPNPDYIGPLTRYEPRDRYVKHCFVQRIKKAG